jgi:hypothetical protein
MEIRSARSYFPGTQDRVFLDAACVSLMPVQASEALQRLEQELLTCTSRDASAPHIKLDRLASRALAWLTGQLPPGSFSLRQLPPGSFSLRSCGQGPGRMPVGCGSTPQPLPGCSRESLPRPRS